jgi:hypothetical protein
MRWRLASESLFESIFIAGKPVGPKAAAAFSRCCAAGWLFSFFYTP